MVKNWNLLTWNDKLGGGCNLYTYIVYTRKSGFIRAPFTVLTFFQSDMGLQILLILF